MRFFFTGPEAAWRDAIFFHKRFVKNRIITKAALFGNFFQWKAGIDQIFRFDQSPLGNDFVKAGVKLQSSSVTLRLWGWKRKVSRRLMTIL